VPKGRSGDPRGSPHGGHDSQLGSNADEMRDVSAGLKPAAFRAGHSTAHAAARGVALHRTGRRVSGWREEAGLVSD